MYIHMYIPCMARYARHRHHSTQMKTKTLACIHRHLILVHPSVINAQPDTANDG